MRHPIYKVLAISGTVVAMVLLLFTIGVFINNVF